MNNIVLITIGVTLGIGGTVIALLPLLKKNGVQVDKVLEKADTILDGADTVVGVVDKLLPNNPAIGVLKVIEKYAHIGVSHAEQLYIASQLSKEERNDKSKDTIYAALNLLDIKITPEISKVIDGAIEAECLALGHKEKTQQEINDENMRLKQENQNLTNVVNQIKGIVPVQ